MAFRLSPLFSRRSSCSNGRRVPRRASVHFWDHEPLEARRLFAVTAGLANGTLTVTSDFAGDDITVTRDTTQGGDNLLVYVGNVSPVGWTWPTGNVSKIVMNGNGGNDQLWVESAEFMRNGNVPITIPAELNGGSGSDTLSGGDGDDVLHGDADNDFLYDAGGDDESFGDGGDDWLSGGDGDDTLHGGDDNDTVFDNPSNDHDHVYGDAGDDGVGAGDWDTNDLIDGGAGNDSLLSHDDNGTTKDALGLFP